LESRIRGRERPVVGKEIWRGRGRGRKRFGDGRTRGLMKMVGVRVLVGVWRLSLLGRGLAFLVVCSEDFWTGD
jgi:hypothetical protein